MAIQIDRIDHIVLTASNVQRTLEFYVEVLGMKPETFGENRRAVSFGRQKINLHQRGNEFEPKAKSPTTGSVDVCFIANTPIAEIIEHLKKKGGVDIEVGPVKRTGAAGPIESVYFRDPDGNLIELANYL